METNFPSHNQTPTHEEDRQEFVSDNILKIITQRNHLLLDNAEQKKEARCKQRRENLTFSTGGFFTNNSFF